MSPSCPWSARSVLFVLGMAAVLAGCASPAKRPDSADFPYAGRWDLDVEASVRRQMAAKGLDWNKMSADRQKEAVQSYPLLVQIVLRSDGTWEGFFRMGGQKGTAGAGKFTVKETGRHRWDFIFMEEKTPDRTIGAELQTDALILQFNPSDPVGIVLRRRTGSAP